MSALWCLRRRTHRRARAVTAKRERALPRAPGHLQAPGPVQAAER